MGRTTNKVESRRPDPIEDEPPLGLDDVIRQRLTMFSTDGTRTWAEALADALIKAAVGGDLKSLDALSRRVGSAPESVVTPILAIDDETARRILEAARGPVKARSSD
ncbi:hypothetical protein [Paludisphaera rhizosphaerae]|uniref:hypothetical protein n=1 Tax=Paludisphaera rhizosphaerae TaxID=2711216 RepID=UPI0013ECEB9C|nr:hypothetical protein [Paludisphaera rhizosphaerae]